MDPHTSTQYPMNLQVESIFEGQKGSSTHLKIENKSYVNKLL